MNITDALVHPNPLTISYSSRGTLEGCKRRFELYKFYRQPAKRHTSPDMIAGTALHAGFQEYMVTSDKEAAQYAMMRAFDIANSPDPTHYRGLEACYATLENMMSNVNLLEYQIAEIRCLDGVTRPGIEVEFEIWLEGIEVNGRPVVYIGYIDLTLFNVLTQSFAVTDIKSHRDNKGDRTANYAWDDQCIPYSVVLQHIAGHPIDMFNIIYIDTYVDIIEPKTLIYRFQKGPSDMQDWFTGLYYDVKHIKEYAERSFFPRTGHGCKIYNSPCQYLQLCGERDPKVIQGLILGDHEEGQVPLVRSPWVRLILPMPTE